MGKFLSLNTKKGDFLQGKSLSDLFNCVNYYLFIHVSGTVCKECDGMEGDEACVLPWTYFLSGLHQVCIMCSGHFVSLFRFPQSVVVDVFCMSNAV